MKTQHSHYVSGHRVTATDPKLWFLASMPPYGALQLAWHGFRVPIVQEGLAAPNQLLLDAILSLVHTHTGHKGLVC